MLATLKMLALASALTACGPSEEEKEALTNRPLASFHMKVPDRGEASIQIVRDYAARNGFAMRISPMGRPNSFHADLFRDDVRVAVASLFEPTDVEVAVYALCRCHLKYLPELQTIANRTARELRAELSRAGK